tara:strand:- start:35820 stop:38270 length:2451 start_codon:yes stop_codon:yes gene_type:complete
MQATEGVSPDIAAIRADLEFFTRRWAELNEPVWLELRSLIPGDQSSAKHAHFTADPDGLALAADWAASMNFKPRNVYAVRNPIRQTCVKAAKDTDVVAAFYLWADADDSGATEKVARFQEVKASAIIKTGRIPATRAHFYWECEEPCYNLEAWTARQKAIAAHFGSDSQVVNPSRIMRVAGTVTWPAPHKVAKGYVPEVTAMRTDFEDDREPIPFERAMRIWPDVTPTLAAGGSGFIDTGPQAMDREQARIKALSGKEWRTEVLRHVGSYVSKGLFDYEILAITDHFTLAGYTVDQTRAEVQEMIDYTRRNPRFGHVVPSMDEGAALEATQPEDTTPPVDLWAHWEPPALPRGLLPPVIEDYARAQADLMGADAGGIAAACLAVCAAATPDSIRVQVKAHDEGWQEPARLWVALVGPPSAKKSPILSAATKPLLKIDRELFRDWQRRMAAWEALPKEEQKQEPKPRQTRMRLEDTTIEAAQQVFADSPEGLLLLQDELSGWFGAMDKYSGGRGSAKDRGFWLQSFNGGGYAVNRVGRGASFIENLSCSLLGGIQPEPLRKIAGDSVDDGLLQRLFPITLTKSTLSRDEPAPREIVDAYWAAIEGLHSLRPPFDVRLTFDAEAQDVRRDLERKHLDLMNCEAIQRKLAAHIGKYDGLFARLCVLWHCLDFSGQPTPPPVITGETARRVARFLHEFLLPHSVNFYTGILGMSDDHDRLEAVATYILTRKLETVTHRDVQRGDRSMRGMTHPEIDRILQQLHAFGWLEPAPVIKAGSARRWVVNPIVHSRFERRGREEAKRREAARKAVFGMVRNEDDE